MMKKGKFLFSSLLLGTIVLGGVIGADKSIFNVDSSQLENNTNESKDKINLDISNSKDEGDTLHISSVEDLKGISTDEEDTKIVLDNDIEINNSDFDQEDASSIKSHFASFDGGGHTLSVDDSFRGNFNLFEKITINSSFTISNLKLDGFITFANEVDLNEDAELILEDITITNFNQGGHSKNNSFFKEIYLDDNLNSTFNVDNFTLENSVFDKFEGNLLVKEFSIGDNSNLTFNLKNINLNNNIFELKKNISSFSLLVFLNNNSSLNDSLILNFKNIIIQKNIFKIPLSALSKAQLNLFSVEQISTNNLVNNKIDNILFLNNDLENIDEVEIIFPKNGFKDSKSKISFLSSKNIMFVGKVLPQNFLLTDISTFEGDKTKNQLSTQISLKESVEDDKETLNNIEDIALNEMNLRIIIDNNDELKSIDSTYQEIEKLSITKTKKNMVNQMSFSSKIFLNNELAANVTNRLQNVTLKYLDDNNEYIPLAKIDQVSLTETSIDENTVLTFDINKKSHRLTKEETENKTFKISFNYELNQSLTFNSKETLIHSQEIAISKKSLYDYESNEWKKDVIDVLNSPFEISWYWIILIILIITILSIIFVLFVIWFQRKNPSKTTSKTKNSKEKLATEGSLSKIKSNYKVEFFYDEENEPYYFDPIKNEYLYTTDDKKDEVEAKIMLEVKKALKIKNKQEKNRAKKEASKEKKALKTSNQKKSSFKNSKLKMKRNSRQAKNDNKSEEETPKKLTPAQSSYEKINKLIANDDLID